MRLLKNMVIILIVLLLSCGCNDLKNEVEEATSTEETTEIERETLTDEETKEAQKVYKGEYAMSDGTLSFSLLIDDKGHYFINGVANDSNKAAIMYITLAKIFQNLDNINASITIECDKGSVDYTRIDTTSYVGGKEKNADGTTNTIMFKYPQWVNEAEIDMSEKENIICSYETINTFSQFLYDNLGINYTPLVYEETTSKKTNSLTEYSYKQKYDVTGGTIEYLYIIDGNKSLYNVTAKVNSTETANIVFLSSVGIYEKMKTDSIDYLLTVECEEGSLVYTSMGGNIVAGGADSNGNVTDGFPKWYNSDIDFNIDNNMLCFNDTLNSFSSFLSDVQAYMSNKK